MPPKARITGIGISVPEKVLTNSDLEKMVNTSDEWIRSRTGILERRINGEGSGKQASDFGAEASLSALARAGITAGEIDCIICGTFTPDFAFPATACLIQEKIGAKNATAFDITAACSGFVFGLDIANAYIQSGRYRNILIVGTEITSKVVNWSDRKTCVLFGDGAGAAVVSACEGDFGVLSTYTRTDGSLSSILYLPAWGDPRYIQMSGSDVFKNAVRMMGESVMRALENAGIPPEQVDVFVPHQANIRIIRATAKQVNMPMEKVVVNVDRYGNTSSTSIPLALKEALDDGRIKEGNIVVMAAFGGGLTWGAAVLRW